jgi:hypothetical protein
MFQETCTKSTRFLEKHKEKEMILLPLKDNCWLLFSLGLIYYTCRAYHNILYVSRISQYIIRVAHITISLFISSMTDHGNESNRWIKTSTK